jgi:hypothetical protein
MLRLLLRSAIVGTVLFGSASVPSVATAQSLSFTSCAVPGVCGFVEAFFTGTFLTVRVSNLDNTFGSALFTTHVTFAGPLGGAPGTSFTRTANASLVGNVSAVGTTPANAWSYTGVGGSSILDLSSFLNVFIEGPAPSAFRAAPGDPDNGTWITTNGYVQFAADLSGVNGAKTARSSEALHAGGCASVTTPEPATFVLLATDSLTSGRPAAPESALI